VRQKLFIVVLLARRGQSLGGGLKPGDKAKLMVPTYPSRYNIHMMCGMNGTRDYVFISAINSCTLWSEFTIKLHYWIYIDKGHLSDKKRRKWDMAGDVASYRLEGLVRPYVSAGGLVSYSKSESDYLQVTGGLNCTEAIAT